MNEFLDSLADATIFSAMVANTNYWKAEVANEDRYKTVFASNFGLLHFIRILNRLKTPPDGSTRNRHHTFLSEVPICTDLSQ